MTFGVLLVLTLIAALVIGAVSVLGSPILAIPIILLLPGPVFAAEVVRRAHRKRQIRRFREQARVRKTEFDDRDRGTLA